MLITKKT